MVNGCVLQISQMFKLSYFIVGCVLSHWKGPSFDLEIEFTKASLKDQVK